MRQLGIDAARVHVEMDYYLQGSVLNGTVESGCTEVRTHFEVNSEEPEAQMLEVIRLAKQGCFVENMVQTAVPLHSTYRLNGTEVAVALE